MGADTPIAAVQFGAEAADAIRECLSRAIELEQLAAIVRPVRHAAEKPAFLVAATVNSSWRGTLESREAHLAAARTRLTAQIGPCLAPLLARGTVSLSVSDGAGAELTRQRIETTPGAVIFCRSNDNAGMSAPGTSGPHARTSQDLNS